MSKFKVGDKVWYEGKVFEIDAVDEILEGQFLYFFDNGYDYEGHEGIYLQPYKTPHQELLDLGWVKKYEDDNFIKYEIEDGDDEEDKIVFALGIDKNLKVFDIDTKELYLRDWYGYPIDLQLAKILVRYLEEL